MTCELITRCCSLVICTGLLGIGFVGITRAETPAESRTDSPVKEIPQASEQTPKWQHGLSFFGDFKYPPNFSHFEYTNPDAPKGGKLVRSSVSKWNSFTPFIIKGIGAPGLNVIGEMTLYDSLFWPSGDEVGVYYGNLAQRVAVSEDATEIRIQLRPEAKWHDGVPITARDIKFSFEHIKANAYAGVRAAFHSLEEVEIIGEKEVVIHYSYPVNLNNMSGLGKVAMLPEHYWRDRDITETTLEPPLSSGPYRIGDYKLGKFLEMVRVPDYWGRNLGLHRGRHNIDVIRNEVYRDSTVTREAFKKGLLDVYAEGNNAQWVTGYDQALIDDGQLRKDRHTFKQYVGVVPALGFNQSLARLQDVRVREALSLAFDVHWVNDVLFYGVHEMAESYFHGTFLAATDLPSESELVLLEPFRDELPPRVFTHAPFGASEHASLRGRDALIHAQKLLRDAGWTMQDGVLRNGSQHSFEMKILLSSAEFAKWLLPYQAQLKRLGISSEVRVLEASQYQNLLRKGEYDAVFGSLLMAFPPTAEVPAYLHSNSQGTSNFSRLNSPVLDALSDAVLNAGDRESLSTATRALDRVLFWRFDFIPLRVLEAPRVMVWNKFSEPDIKAPNISGFPETWWWDEAKDKKVTRALQ